MTKGVDKIIDTITTFDPLHIMMGESCGAKDMDRQDRHPHRLLSIAIALGSVGREIRNET